MLVSYKLLQTYFSKKLPRPEAIAHALTFHAFEIEEMAKKGADTILDVKILPDRASDCLSHRGLAREIGAILSVPLRPVSRVRAPSLDKNAPVINVSVKDKRVLRYMAVTMEGIAATPSPKWLRDALESLGQRSINNIVDATNYVMFMLGQPLHAFDAGKIDGGKIIVRAAKEGETMTTLDGKDLTLSTDILVIADARSPLGIAGVKGGTKAEVTEKTTEIVLEAANFDARMIRRTAQHLNIRTDASRRFEAGLTPYLAEEALAMAVQMIRDIAGGKSIKVGRTIDVFPSPPKQKTITIRHSDVNRILGTALSPKDVLGVWRALGFHYKTKAVSSSGDVVYAVTAPHERLDLRIKENLVEEVGRMIGYDKLTPRMQSEEMVSPKESSTWRIGSLARDLMFGFGFSEVYTYAFSDTGELKVANPIANDKSFLRNSLKHGLKIAVRENLKYDGAARIFEIGHVFGRNEGNISEEVSFAARMGFIKRKDAELRDDFFALKGILSAIFTELGIQSVVYQEAGGELIASVVINGELLGTISVNGFEINFSRLVRFASFAPPAYQAPSRFPPIVRDISLFVPLETPAGSIEEFIRKSAGNLLRSLTIFDVFVQPECKSLAFRMVLQSFDKTLSDNEANAVYDTVVASLQSAHPLWKVRS